MPLRLWPFAVMILPLAACAALLAWQGTPPLLTGALLLVLGVVLALLTLAVAGHQHEPDAAPPPGADSTQFLRAGMGRELMELLPQPLFLIEQGGRIGYANLAARDMFPRLSQARHFANLLRAPAFVEAVNAAFEADEVQEAEFVLYQGGELHLRAHVCPTRGELADAGAPVLVLVEDRTHDRKIEALRSDFIANASHELKTPLASILGSIETLQGPARDDPAGQARFLALMARQAERMKRLVEDLLSLSQIELGEHLAPRTECDLVDAAREAAAAVSPLMKKQGVTLETALPAAPHPVRGDRDQLIQVFVNLLENALKYGRPEGRVVLASADDDPRFPGMWGVSVIDDGPGIAREHVPRLTERFYRVSAKASRDKGGTGLGLAIVKHVLNRHRGELQIESAPGAGSRFTVRVPKGPESVSQTVTPEAQQNIPS
ncbi:cell wall metabolism sensor histidine kinase WalK [Oceanicella sp. SM1341]|uniref:sensor histidine kinase n=1 Tax=Oceanicella sp. SM1341 TaxID=1548889 RepID=UPI000E4ADB0A|nr:ATP-binding protein [Oceanicella sp. SM1341]